MAIHLLMVGADAAGTVHLFFCLCYDIVFESKESF